MHLKRLRFSLRMLLVTIAVLAVALAFWAAPLIRQQLAIRAIEAHGGRAFLNASTVDEVFTNQSREPSTPEWLSAAIGSDMRTVTIQKRDRTGTDVLRRVSELHGLEVLSLTRSTFDERELARLKACPSLRYLFLQDTAVGDSSIEFLRQARNLEMLNLARTKVSDGGMVHISKCSKLKYLCLNETGVSDGSVPILCSFKDLTDLEIHNTKFSDEGVKQIQTTLPACKIKR